MITLLGKKELTDLHFIGRNVVCCKNSIEDLQEDPQPQNITYR